MALSYARRFQHWLHNLAENLKQPPPAKQPSTHPTIEKDSSAPQVTHTLHIPDATIDRIKRKPTEETRREWWQDFRETIGLALVVLYAFFTFLQWQELNTANINQSTANTNAAITADRTIRQGQEALRQSQNNFQASQRAWVGVNISHFSPIKNGNGTMTFVASGTIRNSGYTPALKVTMGKPIGITKPSVEPINYDKEWEAGIERARKDEKLNRKAFRKYEKSYPAFAAVAEAMAADISKRWNGEGGAIAPNSEFPHTFINVTLTDPQPTIVPTTETLYWIGPITYRDIFSDKIHTTKFCIWYSEEVLELCPDGNFME